MRLPVRLEMNLFNYTLQIFKNVEDVVKEGKCSNKSILKRFLAYEWNSLLCILSDTVSFIDSFLSYAADMVLPHKGNFMD